MPPAAGASGFFWQPVAANPRRTKHPVPKMRLKALFLTLSSSENLEPELHLSAPDDARIGCGGRLRKLIVDGGFGFRLGAHPRRSRDPAEGRFKVA